jgi:hypothetical protein
MIAQASQMESSAAAPQQPLRRFDRISLSVSSAISYAAGAALVGAAVGGLAGAVGAATFAGVAGLLLELRSRSSK